MKWRVIVTDTECLTGVAPICERQDDPEGLHHIYEPGVYEAQDTHGVYDCCPHPHLETYDERLAPSVAAKLTEADVSVCT